MKHIKSLAFICVLIASLIGAIYCIHASHTATNPTPKESFQLSVLLFLLSSAASVILGYYFARLSTDEKVDTIAERSTEKMVNLSIQLHALKDYLQDTEFIADDEGTSDLARCTYRHRLEAASIMAASLASTNETFRSDWLGVVSSRTRNTIETRYDTLKQLLQDYDTVEKLRRVREHAEPSSADVAELESQIKKLEERIATNRQSLPVLPSSIRIQSPAPAVAINQKISDGAGSTSQEGELHVTVLRTTFTATGSGKLSPHMNDTPKLEVTIISAPEGYTESDFPFRPGTGTNYDFNISIKSKVYNTPIPIGTYIFRYKAVARILESNGKTVEQTDPANRPPFGTSVIAPADPATRAGAMPEARGDS